jgi:hypothetical protein
MEDTPKDKVPNVEYNAFLREFKYVFSELLGLPPGMILRMEIYFKIYKPWPIVLILHMKTINVW